VQQEAEIGSSELNRSRIYGSQHSDVRSYMAQKIAYELVQKKDGGD